MVVLRATLSISDNPHCSIFRFVYSNSKLSFSMPLDVYLHLFSITQGNYQLSYKRSKQFAGQRRVRIDFCICKLNITLMNSAGIIGQIQMD